MACISISGLYNKKSFQFSKSLANELGFKFIDKEILDKVMRDYGYTNFLTLYEKDPGILYKIDTDQELEKEIAFFNQVVIAIAKVNDVIFLGSGINLILHPFSDNLNIRLYASDDFLIDDISKNENISKDLAKDKRKEQKQEEKRFLRGFYGKVYKKRLINDFSCNIEKVDIFWLSEVIKKIIKSLTGEGISVKDVNIHPVLLNNIIEIIEEYK
ncbi:MAG: cytidylate kinase family protein [Spirochaetes bacterium]|nr:cytidylate kinase family protein [Spirochaetota bacterium]